MMKKLKEKILVWGMKQAMKIGGGLAQNENVFSGEENEIQPEMSQLLRELTAEGAVLLENRALPLQEGTKVAVFGRCQVDYFYTGYGSGGDVCAPYRISLIEGLHKAKEILVDEGLSSKYQNWSEENPIDHGVWGHWPRYYPEMPLAESEVERIAQRNDVAVVVLGRSSGEDRDSTLEKGSFYLTDEEIQLLDDVTEHFEQTIILLNIGSLIDFSWVEKYREKLGALMIVWQGGMESGNGIADLLTGKTVPSGRLTATIAKKYQDYPSANHFGEKKQTFYAEDIYVGYRWFETFKPETVSYPFGYGLSYTTFETTVMTVEEFEDTVHCTVKVTNTGITYCGKEMVALYLEKPCGTLGNPSRTMLGFAKTECLKPGESQALTLSFELKELASYDSVGAILKPSSYVIEPGKYTVFVGQDVRSIKPIWQKKYKKALLVQQLTEACAPQTSFMITTASLDEAGKYKVQEQAVPMRKSDLKMKILKQLPIDYGQTGDCGYKLSDVKSGKISLSEFVAQLSLAELEAITRGDYIMDSPLGEKGNAGVLGGVLPSLREKGIPAITTTDGPSGIRIHAACSLLPIEMLLASTFNCEKVKELYYLVGLEMLERKSDMLLAPGMNIQRNPLCGRNFEYFSEDPIVTGKMGAAVVRGLQQAGVSSCPKHFACNNQERARNRNDSCVSERALREIYLKGFEICVTEAQPQNLMTSYNKINGVWGHYHYELCTEILRGEWGFRGNVVTDWWMKSAKSPEFPKLCDNAYRVRAQVDVLMPGGKRVGKRKSDGTLLKSFGQPEGITLGELQRSAMNVLYYAMHSTRFDEFEVELNETQTPNNA
jgi:beta-glucosidase